MQRLDTHALCDLTDVEIKQVAETTGNRLRFEMRNKSALGIDGQVRRVRIRIPVVVNDRFLTAETHIETEACPLTLMAFWTSDHQKLRCQSTFRQSTSWNGILGLHSDFAPFLFDNGTRIKYVLPDAELHRLMPEAWIGRLSSLTNEEVRERWTDALKSMDPGQQRQIIEWVNNRTGAGVQVLKEDLRAAKEEWELERIQAANDNLLAKIEAQGRTSVFYRPVALPTILLEVESAVFQDERNDLVLTHTQGLVTVTRKRPSTVREVVREREKESTEAPLGLAINRYKQHELGIRLMASCAFLERGAFGAIYEVPAPPKLVHTMLEVSHKRARALVGIIEHPAVKPDGSLIQGSGFDPGTGFYTNVPAEMVPELPEIITEKIAAQSYAWICDQALADFPFATELDRAGAVAMILTTIQRRLLIGSEGVPMFATSAPVQGTGKTALIRLMSHLVHGTSVPVTSWPTNDEEMGKHLLAILMEGLPIVLFDNLPEGGRIESDELAKACTAEKYRRRILGENREGEAPTNVVWCFTGNNIQPVGDFNTRTLSIYLDANCENPDRRPFSRDDIEAWCLDHRAEFLYHALIILAGYRRQLLRWQDKFSSRKCVA